MDRFTQALQQLGHIYKPKLEVAERQTRHINKLYRLTGEVRPRCGTEGTGVGCPSLYLDSDCEECRSLEGLPPAAITKRSLMLDLVNLMCDIEQNFIDAMYWNYHNRGQGPINPDPHGVLAKGWIDNKMQLESMLARFEPTMTKHEGRFSWPDEIVENGD